MARPPRWLVVTAVLGALALGAAGAWFYLAQRQYLQQTASANLLAVSQAKLDQIVAWRAERLGDAAVLQESPFFVRAVARWLAGHQPEIAAEILTRLRSTKGQYGYDDLRLVDRAGRVVLATSGRRGALGATAAAALRAAFRGRRPTMSDVHVSSDDSFPHLAVVAPLFALSGRSAAPIGAVVHVVDARRSLFRLVESWPIPSPSAEANLVRRDGDSVLFLTARRFQPGPESPRRISLSRRDVPAVMAVLGTGGVARGVDYRGVRVISALRAVPGTPWFLVAKVDEAEALAVWRTRVALVFAVFLGLVLVAAATVIAVGQRSATARYRRLYEAEAVLGASEARFRTLVEEAGDGFALLDAEGRYLDVNSVRCLQLGYARDDLLRLSISDIDPLFSPERFAADFQSLVGKPPVTYESVHRRKDGTTFPVEVTLSIVRIGGVPQALSLARDITERKRAEEALRREHAMLARTEGIAHVGSWEWDITPDTVTWSDELFRIFQRDPREGAPSFAEHPAFYHPDDMARLRQAVEVAVAEGTPYELELRAIRKDGETRMCVARGIAEMSPGGRAVRLYGSLQDITERKRAEEALKRSSQLLRDTGEMAKVGGWELDLSTKEVSWTEEIYRIHGVESGHQPKLEEAMSFYAPESRPALEEALKKAAETGEPYDLESLFIPSGSQEKIWVRSLGRAVYSGGKIVKLAGTFQNIDKYRRAEEALREKEQELRILFEELPVGVSLLDQNRKMTYANPRLGEILGLSRDDLLQGKYQERPYLRSDGTPMPLEEFASVRAFREQRPIHAVETGIVAKDGRIIWTSVSAAPFPVANKGVLIATADITERKRAEEALRNSEVRHRTILATALDGFWLADMQGRFLEVNEAYSRMSGYSRQELLAMSITDLEATETSTETAARIEKIRTHGADRFESRHRRKDGSIFDVHISVQFQPMEGGRMVVFVRDITERRRAEETLRASEERHRGIIEQLNDVYYRTDRDGCITMMSPSAAQLFGFPSTGEMIGRPIESLWQDPSQRAALLAAIGERGFVRDYETTAVRTDGTPFAVAVSSHYVRDASGAADGVEGIIRDIAERKQAEAALRALARHLDSVREEEHTRIARQIHDELGQALTALRLDLTWVGRKIPKGNTALRRRIDAAVELTDETITVGQRIVEGLRPPILDDLGLVPAVEWYAQHFAKRSGLRIEFDVGAEEPVVPDHLAVAAYRIVQEALTNVARHAQATHARVRLGEQDGALTIEIRDDGQGCSEEVSRDPHSFGIVGMRERAAAHGGELVITSSPGAGTTVRVTFPLERRKEPRVPR